MVGFNLVFAKIQKTHHTAKRYATYFIDKSTSKASLEILSFYDDLRGPTKVCSFIREDINKDHHPDSIQVPEWWPSCICEVKE